MSDETDEQKAAILRAAVVRHRHELNDAKRALAELGVSLDDETTHEGPWQLHEENPWLVLSADDGMLPSITIATVHTGDGDAALIADAPVMLELLRETAQIDLACYCVAATEVGGLARPALVCWPCRVRALLDKHGRG